MFSLKYDHMNDLELSAAYQQVMSLPDYDTWDMVDNSFNIIESTNKTGELFYILNLKTDSALGSPVDTLAKQYGID